MSSRSPSDAEELRTRVGNGTSFLISSEPVKEAVRISMFFFYSLIPFTVSFRSLTSSFLRHSVTLMFFAGVCHTEKCFRTRS